MVRNLSKILFNILFVLFLLIGGLLIYFGILPNRPFIYGLWGLIIFVLNYRVINNKLIILITFFFIYLLLLGYYHSIEIKRILQFSLQLFFPLSIFSIIAPYINEHNFKKIYKVLLNIGLLQLPIVLIQNFNYDRFIKYSSVHIYQNDFNFGTFWPNNDVAMNLFLLLLIVSLFFWKRTMVVGGKKYLYLIIFSLTILISNSKLSILLLLFLVLVILLREVNPISIVRNILLLIVVIGVIFGFSLWDDIQEKIVKGWDQIFDISSEKEEIFLTGGFARGAAINYYLHQPVKIFGDGPTSYVSSDQGVTTSLLGLKGHIFIFYAETGVVGILLSYLLLYLFTRNSVKSKNSIIYLLLISAFTLVTSPLYNLPMLFCWFMVMRIEHCNNFLEPKST